MTKESQLLKPLELEILDVMMALRDAPQSSDLAVIQLVLPETLEEVRHELGDQLTLNMVQTDLQESLKVAVPAMARMMRKVLKFDDAVTKFEALACRINDATLTLHYQQTVNNYELFLEAFVPYLNTFERLFTVVPFSGNQSLTDTRRPIGDAISALRSRDNELSLRRTIRTQILGVLATLAHSQAGSNSA